MPQRLIMDNKYLPQDEEKRKRNVNYLIFDSSFIPKHLRRQKIKRKHFNKSNANNGPGL